MLTPLPITQTHILANVKQVLGIANDDLGFDTDIITYVNFVFGILNQLGVGPEGLFSISGSSETWDLFTANEVLLPLVKVYVVLRVRMLFDTPTNSVLNASLTETIKEQEWRITNTMGLDLIKEEE